MISTCENQAFYPSLRSLTRQPPPPPTPKKLPQVSLTVVYSHLRYDRGDNAATFMLLHLKR